MKSAPSLLLCALVYASVAIPPTWAGVTAEEAAKLKSSLTPFGGERAGSADGAIPPWTGDATTVPPGFKSGDVLPELYADEQPVATITAQNLERYKDRLSAGTLLTFQRHPEYRVVVYPSHRTAIAPQWVYDNTFENATRAQSVDDGLTVRGAAGGIPFPIPKTGREVVWNHLLRWSGESIYQNGSALLRTASGELVVFARAHGRFDYPYYHKGATPDSYEEIYRRLTTQIYDPPFNSGQATLQISPLDQTNRGTMAWQYLVGQRRVRKAPNLAYDTPNFFTSGVGQFDDFQGWDGALDRYQFDLAGKKEVYVPYNGNHMARIGDEEKFSPRYPNPDALRWELHRVWLVDLTLLPGKRNVVARRRLYIDEDTWAVLMADEYDQAGEYWRLILQIPLLVPDLPAVILGPGITMDFHSGAYAVNFNFDPKLLPQWKTVPLPDQTYFTSQNLANLGVD